MNYEENRGVVPERPEIDHFNQANVFNAVEFSTFTLFYLFGKGISALRFFSIPLL